MKTMRPADSRPIGNTYTYCLVDNQGNPKIRVVDSLLKATFGGEDDEVQ